ncbi:MAG: molybdopterin-guanine dinucleotide biosynthesis protein B [Thermodesulfobacteriota bacterium]
MDTCNVPTLAIVGWSGSGKTTLMEALISHFTAAGLRVGAIKHDAHDFSIDHEGKDSWRFSTAGARRTLICSARRLALVEELEQPADIDSVLQRCAPGTDLILVEGFKTAALPKIEVFRPSLGKELLCQDKCRYPHVIAVATDAPPADLSEVEVPLLELNDITAIADFIQRKIILEGI